MRGHQITLVCLVQPERENRYLQAITPFCQRVIAVQNNRLLSQLRALTALPTLEPLSVAYCRSQEFMRNVNNTLQQGGFEILHTEFVRATPATVRLNGVPKVYDAVDSLALAYRRSIIAPFISPKQRFVALLEWLKLRHYEKRILDSYQRIIVSSTLDGKELSFPRKSETTKTRIDVLSNGVDLTYFHYNLPQRNEKQKIIFLGKMSYYVNVASVQWFIRLVYPLIQQAIPEVRFQIVGRDPTKEILKLGNIQGVEVTGEVPDVRPFLESATVAICPMVSGSGIQNKLLEAFAAGVPCVATGLALGSLQVEHGHHVQRAETPDDFAHSVLTLMHDEHLREFQSRSARQYVEEYHCWDIQAARLEEIYTTLISKPSEKTFSVV
jgi:sugar transferase (PEP-CTERM/EpsH1 system associated)